MKFLVATLFSVAYTLLPLLLLAYAYRNRIPRTEWLSYCAIPCVIDAIAVGMEWPGLKLLGLGIMLLATFFLPHAEYKKSKKAFLSTPCPEGYVRLHSEPEEKQNPFAHRRRMSVRVLQGEEAVARLVPENRTHYDFHWYGADLSFRAMHRNTQPLGATYTLAGGEEPIQLHYIGRQRDQVSGGNLPGFELPLNRRFVQLKEPESPALRADFQLFDEGFLLTCKAEESQTMTCLAYYLWLRHFGNQRLEA